MGFNTRRPPRHQTSQMTWFETIGQAAASGAIFRWKCKGCEEWAEADFADLLQCEGPNFPTWNLLSVCPCGAPRVLHASPSHGTPLRALKDDYLWILREVGYGRDPDAWFEIDWME